ncbi:MAG TPA: hypothetical protein PKI93_07545 [Alphaproteobacteria bacterium]|nr:hypothetical protein [Alphaproteobacteria bacterium]HNS44995.1 hypothetical protein [Alphaproteobacteria bacterium]
MKSLFHLCHLKADGAGFDPSTMPSSVGRGHSGRCQRVEGPSFTLTDVARCLFGIRDALQVKGNDSFVITSFGKPVVTVKFHDADVMPEGDNPSIRCIFEGSELSVIREAVNTCLDLRKPTELVFREGRGKNKKYLGATVFPI